MYRLLTLPFLILIFLFLSRPAALLSQQEKVLSYIIQPGDTWTALSYRMNVSPTRLMQTAGVVNPQMQPVIGSSLSLHDGQGVNGKLSRPLAGGLLGTSVRFGSSPWALSLQNNISHPYSPLMYTPVFLPGGSNLPKELPTGFNALSISDLLARPGQALALQARLQPELGVKISLDETPWNINRNRERMIALGATDAFFGSGAPEIRIQVAQHPLWTQPWLFEDKDWYYDQVKFTDTAATELEAMENERERLRLLWEHNTAETLWTSTFSWPLQDYVELSSHYGARRSINGGPYDTYHEGTDFSAYRGTQVLAPAGGRVILAETLAVRGGAVILDHGLGIHTGYYHLSEITVNLGEIVAAGDKLGEVGSTGRSTGNHLHWDLLIETIWVDAEAWTDSNLAGWIRNGWGAPFPEMSHLDMPQNPSK